VHLTEGRLGEAEVVTQARVYLECCVFDAPSSAWAGDQLGTVLAKGVVFYGDFLPGFVVNKRLLYVIGWGRSLASTRQHS
jgi:hypothetical protein